MTTSLERLTNAGVSIWLDDIGRVRLAGGLALRHVDVGEALRAITTYDVRWACDVLRPVFDGSAPLRTEGRHAHPNPHR